MHTGDQRATLPESRSLGSQPTYYLFIRTVCPGGPRHDGIDYANSRNRPSWPEPPRNYASTPSRFGLSLSPSLAPSLSHSFLWTRSFEPPLLSPSLFALRTLPSSFFKLIHPLSFILEPQRLLSFYRVVDPPLSFLLSPRRTLIPRFIM